MARKGENIYKRKDGRYEGRYIISYDENGKAKYAYVYDKTYSGVREKLSRAKTKTQSSNFEDKSSSNNTKYEYWLHEWLSKKKLSVKDSTYIRYRNMITELIADSDELNQSLRKFPPDEVPVLNSKRVGDEITLTWSSCQWLDKRHKLLVRY